MVYRTKYEEHLMPLIDLAEVTSRLDDTNRLLGETNAQLHTVIELLQKQDELIRRRIALAERQVKALESLARLSDRQTGSK